MTRIVKLSALPAAKRTQSVSKSPQPSNVSFRQKLPKRTAPSILTSPMAFAGNAESGFLLRRRVRLSPKPFASAGTLSILLDSALHRDQPHAHVWYARELVSPKKSSRHHSKLISHGSRLMRQKRLRQANIEANFNWNKWRRVTILMRTGGQGHPTPSLTPTSP